MELNNIMNEYQSFLKKKIKTLEPSGFEVTDEQLNPFLFDFQKYITKRALKSGKFALFSDTGTGKTIMQLGIIERAIKMWTNPGEAVFTPFMGIGSEVYEAVNSGRKGIGIELKDSYFNQACDNMKNLELNQNQMELF